jgi:glycosyltransferase involved in cell wall biosynthesis
LTRTPAVSVVVATRARPQYLQEAIESVIAQTFRDFEIVVVVDGPDDETEGTLRAIEDERLRIVVLPTSAGSGGARNAGIAAATGEWIALLDDDDLWLPRKLERQLETIAASGIEQPIGFSARFVRTHGGDIAWRDRGPAAGEHPSEYMFVRRSLRLGESTVSTSTIVARRSLFQVVPFAPALRRYQDADWVLRAAATGAGLVYCPERLAIWRAPRGDESITGAHATDWRSALEWIRARRELVTRRAYGAFILVRVAALAAAGGDTGAAPGLWREAWTAGRPDPRDVLMFLGRWIVPGGLRRLLRTRLATDG